MVGLSRPYLRVHWPSEMLAGLVIGALCALASACVLHIKRRR
ncbi:MAG: phosphatase PAP2 family protein [Dechloromonas sp.]|nr:phosphatase PAP2 family protein [Dechloromonas sp.]